VADKGYRAHEAWPGATERAAGAAQWHTPRAPLAAHPAAPARRVIEALIGHIKVDGLMDRNWFKGTGGDAMHAILCAAGQNLRLLLRAIAAFLRLDLRAVLEWFKSFRLSLRDPTRNHHASTVGLCAC
jgi:hypothetical protein